MTFADSCRPRARLVAFALALAALAAATILSCSSDPPSPLGSDSDLIGSKPGTVYQDTISAFGDTVYAFNSMIVGDSTMELGREDGYQRAMILQPNLSAVPAADTFLVVTKAELRLSANSAPGSFPARFYQLRDTYAEGDSMASLDTLSAIVNPLTGSPTRSLQVFPELYQIPSSLAQMWIRRKDTRTAIAVVYTDAVNDRVATFRSRTAGNGGCRLVVTFLGGTQRIYKMSADATFARPTAPMPNLVASDGYVRRVYFRVHLDELAGDAAVHAARVRFHIVPGTALGDNTTVLVYVPNSTDPASKSFLEGQAVTEATFALDDETLEFPVTNALFLVLQGTLKDNGFVVRFKFENTSLRQLGLYGSAAVDSLQPQIFVTSSTPADYDP